MKYLLTLHGGYRGSSYVLNVHLSVWHIFIFNFHYEVTMKVTVL